MLSFNNVNDVNLLYKMCIWCDGNNGPLLQFVPTWRQQQFCDLNPDLRGLDTRLCPHDYDTTACQFKLL